MTDDLEGSETALSEVLAVLAALSFVYESRVRRSGSG
jgi:hypothetical protein